MEKLEYAIRKSFSKVVCEVMAKKKMSQADLGRASMLSRTTINRLCRDSNDKKSTYQPTLPVVCSVCIGLKLDREEATDLLLSAFPELELLGIFLDRHFDIYDVNDALYVNGLPLWTAGDSSKE